MNKRMARCMECGAYTLKDECPGCRGRAVSPHPSKFSPEDRYGKYRRRLKALAEQEGE